MLTVNAQYLPNGKAYVRTSNLVHRRRTKTGMSDKRRDLKVEVARSPDASDRGVGR